MAKIKIHYNGRTPEIVQSEEVVSGQLKTIEIQFTFSKEWDMYANRTAVFTSSAATREWPLNEEGTVRIPRTVICSGVRAMAVSVFGVAQDENGEYERYNGKLAGFRVEMGGRVPGEGCKDADPSMYEVLLTAIAKKLDAYQGTENAGRVLVVGEDGIVRPGNVSGSVEVDDTLTQSGKAADAKTVGDKFAEQSKAIETLEGKIPSEVGGMTAAQISALDGMFKIASYTADPTAAYSAFRVAFGMDESGGEVEPDEPENPDVTLTSIAVKYSGGDVDVGTALSDLTGIVVTATYSDGSTKTVSGYTLSGEIAEGVNIITVSYGGLTATFTVTGVAETVTYTVTNNLTNVTNSNSQTEVTEGFYSATLSVVDGYSLESVVITMGGVDITESVYTAETGSILITEVTGDIVVTATAAALAYVAMASADISTDSVKLYTDDTTTALATKYYQKGRYSLNATESDAVVKVRLTNNTDADISTSNVYVGSTNEQAIRNPNSSINVSYAVSGNKGTVAAGGSVEIEYTVRAGYWLYVCGYDSLTVEVIGVLDIHEIGETLATTSKEVDSFTVYSDDGTTQITKATYVYVYATTERFETDTDVRVTFVSSGPVSGNILMGCVESGTLTANVTAHYGDWRAVSNFVTGAVISYEFTVKAGYYFAYAQGKNTTIYVEKA